MRNNFFEKDRIKIFENGQIVYQCGDCSEFKPVELFNKNKLKKSGIDYRCKACRKKYRNENIEKIIKMNAEYKLKNKEKIKEYDKKYSKTTAGKQSLARRSKKYRLNNKEKVRKMSNFCKMRLRKTKPHYRVRDNLRGRLYEILKAKNIKKVVSSTKIVGCSGEQLKKYIENQFCQGMFWETLYNNFVIDHIISCHCYDFNNPEEIKECWNYKNLRPLFKTENTKKSLYDKRIGDFLKTFENLNKRSRLRHIIHQNHLKTVNFGETFTHLNTSNVKTCESVRIQDTFSI